MQWWSSAGAVRARWPKNLRRWDLTTSETGVQAVTSRTVSFVVCLVYGIRRIFRRHQASNASRRLLIVFVVVFYGRGKYVQLRIFWWKNEQLRCYPLRKSTLNLSAFSILISEAFCLTTQHTIPNGLQTRIPSSHFTLYCIIIYFSSSSFPIMHISSCE